MDILASAATAIETFDQVSVLSETAALNAVKAGHAASDDETFLTLQCADDCAREAFRCFAETRRPADRQGRDYERGARRSLLNAFEAVAAATRTYLCREGPRPGVRAVVGASLGRRRRDCAEALRLGSLVVPSPPSELHELADERRRIVRSIEDVEERLGAEMSLFLESLGGLV